MNLWDTWDPQLCLPLSEKKSATVVSTTAGTQAGDTKYQAMLELYWDKGLNPCLKPWFTHMAIMARCMPSVQYAAIPLWLSVLMNNRANYTEIQFSFAQYLHAPWPALLVLMWSSLSQPIMQAPCCVPVTTSLVMYSGHNVQNRGEVGGV